MRHLEEALAGLTDAELHALKIASDESPQVAPGLPAWIGGAGDWELVQPSTRLHYTLQPPEAAIGPSEDKVSIEATHALRASLAGSDLAMGALVFFDALLELLIGNDRLKH